MLQQEVKICCRVIPQNELLATSKLHSSNSYDKPHLSKAPEKKTKTDAKQNFLGLLIYWIVPVLKNSLLIRFVSTSAT